MQFFIKNNDKNMNFNTNTIAVRTSLFSKHLREQTVETPISIQPQNILGKKNKVNQCWLSLSQQMIGNILLKPFK